MIKRRNSAINPDLPRKKNEPLIENRKTKTEKSLTNFKQTVIV